MFDRIIESGMTLEFDLQITNGMSIRFDFEQEQACTRSCHVVLCCAKC
jgi:hypothetical protein